MAKEIPILFSTPMVQAILDGRKTMTRRVVKSGVPLGNWSETAKKCPYGQPGDILWVRENWQLVGWSFEDGDMTVRFQTGEKFNCQCPDPTEDLMWLLNQVERLENGGYITKDPDNDEQFMFTTSKQPFKPSIHMPKDACRIWLQVTNVRAERLKDISERDAIAEGIETCFPVGSQYYKPNDYKNYTWHGEGGDDSAGGYSDTKDAKDSFKSLWYKINGQESWEANPWVWVVEFKVLSTSGRPLSILPDGSTALMEELKKSEIF